MPLPPTITDNNVYPISPATYPLGGTPKLSWATAGTYYGYCTIADVLYEIPDADQFANVTSSALAQEITYAGQHIQDQLARFYTMPYAGTDAGILMRLREMNAKLAAAYLWRRMFSGAEPNASPWAAAYEAEVAAIIQDIETGRIQWVSPFGDAIAQAEKATYPLASGATVMPSPDSADPFQAAPFFVMGRMRFRGRGGNLT